ncbi:hypothetical protein GDO78_006484 [Eleutherodactylus coqui]|uniref:Uncharacterized protein n=1 Tax=Eleutherodactylus coqui TaxID=57060 RepID=A0A8J6FQG7_ELECQ|nr:hypothetical protein GDO78_006484 [Eleutherodactylus coqui]
MQREPIVEGNRGIKFQKKKEEMTTSRFVSQQQLNRKRSREAILHGGQNHNLFAMNTKIPWSGPQNSYPRGTLSFLLKSETLVKI